MTFRTLFLLCCAVSCYGQNSFSNMFFTYSTAETKTGGLVVSVTNSVELKEGEVLRWINGDQGQMNGSFQIHVTYPDASYQKSMSLSPSGATMTPEKHLIAVGPCLVHCVARFIDYSSPIPAGETYSSMVTLLKELPSYSTDSAEVVPSTAVVIPSDAIGPVEIVMESSSDMISWTSTLPGTYGASHTNRFFRLRSVRR